MARDPYKYFRGEARDLLDQMSASALTLEKGVTSPERVAQLLRLAHTLKGAARVVKERAIADEAHAVEGVLQPYREGGGWVTTGDVETILARLDAIGGRLAHLGAPKEPAAETRNVAPDEPTRLVRADVAEIDNLLDSLLEAHLQLAALKRSLATVTRARHLADLIAGQLAAPKTRDAGRGSLVQRPLALTEELQALFRPFEKQLTSTVLSVDRELTQACNTAERLRLVPAGVLFTALERVVRDASMELKKRVTFEGLGGTVRLDSHVLGVLESALVQVVRNAVAHGIEPEAARSASGKSREGRVVVEVVQEGQSVVFRCRDDGRGVDLGAVRTAAARQGWPASELDALGPNELMGLLLAGGISTAQTVTDLSGRGIGLDIVREAAARLGGAVTVHTESGRGTKLEIAVPLSLAAVESLILEDGGVTATIPIAAVLQTLRLTPEQFTRTPEGDTVLYGGKVVPFVSLACALGTTASSVTSEGPCSAIVVRGALGIAAIGVNRLLGCANVLCRSLPALAPASSIAAGISLDAEGTPRIALDAEALIAAARTTRITRLDDAPLRRPVLVVDDSLTTRMLEQSILESAGFEVELATSGEEGLEKAQQKPYALFLVDVEMPGMDGFTFIERARADPRLKSIPAILVTSRSSPVDVERGREVGARGYVIKSEFNQDALLESIRQLVH